MAIQNYSTASQRIGKVKGEIIAHAVPVEVLGLTGQQKQIPKNSGDTVVYRRWLPYGATSSVPNQFFSAGTGDRTATMVMGHLTSEGITPAAEAITPMDVSVTLNQYSVLYSMTDKTVDMYEDDVPAEMKKQVGERMGLIREMIRFGALKAITNKFYGGSGTSRGTVNGKITPNLLRKVSRSLQANHAKRITSILAPSTNFATAPVEAGYLVFCHTDLETDIRDLPGFKHTSEYGQRKVMHEQELGSWRTSASSPPRNWSRFRTAVLRLVRPAATQPRPRTSTCINWSSRVKTLGAKSPCAASMPSTRP